MKKTIKLVIADDHSMFRQGLIGLFEHFPEIHGIGEAGNGEELLQLLNNRKADLILLDIQMPVMNGSKALDIITTRHPDVRIIMVSADYSPYLLEEYIKKGIHGFIPKGCDIELLIEAIREVHTHGECLEFSRNLIRRKSAYFKNQFKLSEKELLVLSMTCKGCSHKEIALALDMAERTIEFHKTNIYAKTKFKSLAEMIAYGIKNGLDSV